MLEFADEEELQGPPLEYLCARCLRGVAAAHSRCLRLGREEHTFANPAGLLFDIACFFEAPGARVEGIPTSEFSWFPGYFWQYCSCRSCGLHLGWRYRSDTDSFFGLIVQKLIEGPGS